MRVPILLALPAQEPLRASAAAAMSKRESKISIKEAKIPSRFFLDTEFSAVPLGKAEQGFLVLEALGVDKSQDFAVRGSIEVESAESIPETLDGHPVFSDPLIAPFPYCAGAAQGTFSNVKQSLNTAGLLAKQLDGSNVAIAIVDSGINLRHLQNKLGVMPRFDAANSWYPNGATANPGQYPVDHGTMCAFDALIAAPNATLLDYPVLATNAPRRKCYRENH